MAVTRIPNFYRPGIGTGGPLRWQDLCNFIEECLDIGIDPL